MLKPVLRGGEILLDFISKEVGKGLDHSVLFEKRPGGSIFNVVVGLRRLGVSISLLEKPASDAYLELLNMFYKEKVITSSKLVEILTFANGIATIVGTRYGASNSMPGLQEAEEFISLSTIKRDK